MFDIIKADKTGRFNGFGGCYLPENLMAPILELQKNYKKITQTLAFKKKFNNLLNTYAGRPTPLTEIARFSAAINGPRIYLKREDLLHTGAHKINNALGQCLLAKYMGKKRIIAETGAGQHGVATATACAYLGLQCVVYMGEIDMQRQAMNVQKMKLLGAEVCAVQQGSKTLKDAVNEALRDWSQSYESTHYCIGSALGPHPYPEMVAAFQSVIGEETYQQCLKQIKCLPNYIIACVGGGSNAIGIFNAFVKNKKIKLLGVEAGGTGNQLGLHAARFQQPETGVLHGCLSYILQDEHGQIAPTHSISAGLDYPSIGPQHAAFFQSGRVAYHSVTDQEALHAFQLLSATEGIIPALESSHALAYAVKAVRSFSKNDVVVINLSGRGDKDLQQVISHLI